MSVDKAEEALRILSSMPLDHLNRAKFVEIAGYDPNERWAGATGEHSLFISKLMRSRGIKPRL